jgi:hypothetical protein
MTIAAFCGQEMLRANFLSLQKLLLLIFPLLEWRGKLTVFAVCPMV